eukprot:TRINITY_DN8502_c0_g1_i1.p1 TRINITY_DN8502_c0_g1~~TRINITY_DN8502_c0_g1_i1.p1  ORF type:complete len:722 (-),score=173.06 TRINITY_DN8502_c0_g1_i1:106-2271(-)
MEGKDENVLERVARLMEKMSLEEKIGQLLCLSARPTREKTEHFLANKNMGSMLNVIGKEDSNRYQEYMKKHTNHGIPVLFGIDAVHGHALCPGATIFPSQLGLSCSWNADLLKKVGEVTAKECRATGVHWTYSPVCDIARDLRWGRVNETFGEDPYLSSVLVGSVVTGYEGKDRPKHTRVLSCAKHFAGYSQTVGGRDSTEAELTKRALCTTFFPSFHAAVDAGCSTIMTAYMTIDGLPCTANHWLLTEVLREQWNFQGFVVTDYANIKRMTTEQFVREDAKKACAEAVLSGNDMMMGSTHFYEDAKVAIEKGDLDVKKLDCAVERILRKKFELGLFDEDFLTGDWVKDIVGCEEHKKVALEASLGSVVLLKNEKELLPLKKQQLKKIAIIGPNSDAVLDQLGDWTAGGRWTPGDKTVDRSTIKTVLDGIKESVGGNAEVQYLPGCGVTDQTLSSEAKEQATALAKASDIVIMVLGDPMLWNGEQRDRANLDLPNGQLQLLQAVHETKTPVVLVLVCGKPNCIPWAAEHIDSILVAFNPGMYGGAAIASVLFGEKNPYGRLSISWPRHVGQLPVFYSQLPGWHSTTYVDMPATPQFAFGWGLGYSKIVYEKVEVSSGVVEVNGRIQVRVTLKNEGKMDAVETVQLYKRHAFTSVTTPMLQLIGFKQQLVPANTTLTSEYDIPYKSFSIVNAELKTVVEKGKAFLLVGPNSQQLQKIDILIA